MRILNSNRIPLLSSMEEAVILGVWSDAFLLQVTEDVHRLIADYYQFVCRGQVSVKGKGQMLTYFLEGRSLQAGRSSQSQQQAERQSSAFTHGSVCTRLSPAPSVTTFSTIRNPSPSLAKPTTSTSTSRYLPSVPSAMVWWQWLRSQTDLIKQAKSRAATLSPSDGLEHRSSNTMPGPWSMFRTDHRSSWGGPRLPQALPSTLEACLLFHTAGCCEQDAGCFRKVALCVSEASGWKPHPHNCQSSNENTAHNSKCSTQEDPSNIFCWPPSSSVCNQISAIALGTTPPSLSFLPLFAAFKIFLGQQLRWNNRCFWFFLPERFVFLNRTKPNVKLKIVNGS